MAAALIPQGMSVYAFAKSVGVAKSSIQDAVKSGRLADAVFPDGSLDEVHARVLWLATTQTSRQKSPAPRSKLAADADRARGINEVKLETMEVALEAARIELAATKRESIPYTEARRALAAFVRFHRDTILRFAVRYGPDIAAEVGCEEAPLISSLSAHLREAMNAAAKSPKPFPKTAPLVAVVPDEAAEPE